MTIGMTNWRQLHGEHFQGLRVLITGGAGFIGSHLAEALVSLGARVAVIDDLSGGAVENFATFGPVEFVKGSILDTPLLATCVKDCRYVFHLAALGSVPRSVEQPVLYHEANTTGTLNVLNAARAAGVRRVMFAASSSVYGENPVPWVETMPMLPRSPYAATKAAGEALLRAFSASYGMDTASLRYFNIFGPRQNANSAYAAVIAAFAKAYLAGERPVIFGDGEQSRDFTFVHNAVHANLLAARAAAPIAGEVMNVGCGVRISVNELAKVMARAFGRPELLPEYRPERAGDIKHSFADLKHVSNILGYRPITDFEVGLKATCDWYTHEMGKARGALTHWRVFLDQASIESRSAAVGVIGLGYVGLPLLRAFFQAGFPVIGFDIDPKKIDCLKRGEDYLKHFGEGFVRAMTQSPKFDATADLGRLGEADAIIVCVPTPLGPHLEPDVSYIEKTTEAIARTLRAGQLIVLESTTYPGTTREIMLPRFEKKGLACGKDFYLAFSPEREDPGRKDFNTQTIPKLVGGIDSASGDLAVALYRAAIRQVIPVRTAEIAEAAKLMENIYRAVNIAMVNEMKVVLTAMGIDVFEVIEAAATKPFGYQAFYPGPGLGGHCIPIDPFYLTWKAREVGQNTKFIELAGEVNRAMPEYVVQRTQLALNNAGKAIKGSKILVLGLAYKPDVDDVRESPSFELIEKYEHLGADVDYHDPHVPATHKMRRHDLQMKSIALSPEKVAAYDCVVVATHHKAYDWTMIAKHAKLVVDSRGVMRHVENKSNIFPA